LDAAPLCVYFNLEIPDIDTGPKQLITSLLTFPSLLSPEALSEVIDHDWRPMRGRYIARFPWWIISV